MNAIADRDRERPLHPMDANGWTWPCMPFLKYLLFDLGHLFISLFLTTVSSITNLTFLNHNVAQGLCGHGRYRNRTILFSPPKYSCPSCIYNKDTELNPLCPLKRIPCQA